MNLGQHILIALLKMYQLAVSPVLTALFGAAGGCRFTPTCSAYAIDAIRGHGGVAGIWLTLRRLARCQPWGGCGHDPVPPRAANEGCAGNCAGASSAKGIF